MNFLKRRELKARMAVSKRQVRCHSVTTRCYTRKISSDRIQMK